MAKVPADIPAAPGALPLAGHLRQLLRDPLGFVSGLPAHGDLVRVRFGPMTIVVVCDLETTLRVLRDDRIFDKGGLLYDRSRVVLGNGLITCPHADHRRQRRVLQPAFSSERLSRYAPVMTAHAREAAEQWHDGQIIDVNKLMMQLTERIIAEVMFSDALAPAALSTALDDLGVVIPGIIRSMIMPPQLAWLPTPADRRFRRAHTRLRATLGEIIAERRADHADRGDLFSAMLSTAAASREDDDGPLTDTEAIDQAVSFFVAGTETTSSGLAWALYALGRHPEICERVRAEVDEVLGGRPGTYADVPRLELTGRVVTEALRAWPPAGWLLTRTVARDVRLGGHDLPAGTTLGYSPYVIHHRPDLYPAPDRFAPERWDAAHRPRREAFIAFGFGARRCIGDQFAFAEVVLALAVLVARWRFEPLPGPDVRPSVAAGLAPHRLRMRVADHR
ncbi:cytochrome P450 [Actinospica robiniae]|uniref:Cytochrome P450 n=1 Tax=Actinospica robiniae DSM 44927 TaxID=479430 RepID=W9DZ58_9ACTN|nr:cytochrome P450 [Actinospica robiniae]ETA71088.1 cytochrome P450 [Actinospica robiniae DSM 44927]